MVNVFGDTSGPEYLQMMKKVVVTKGKFKHYMDKMRQSYELGFPPYRLHTNPEGTFVTPIRVYDGKVNVLDDVATMEIGARQIGIDDSSKLVYFVKGDGGSDAALQGDRGPSGSRGLKGDSGDQGSVGSRDPAGKRGVEGPGGPSGKISKMDLLEVKVKLCDTGEKG